ncbi:hypothetical protein J6590_093313, partial [Homalodisca vitripennis]
MEKGHSLEECTIIARGGQPAASPPVFSSNYMPGLFQRDCGGDTLPGVVTAQDASLQHNSRVGESHITPAQATRNIAHYICNNALEGRKDNSVPASPIKAEKGQNSLMSKLVTASLNARNSLTDILCSRLDLLNHPYVC